MPGGSSDSATSESREQYYRQVLLERSLQDDQSGQQMLLDPNQELVLFLSSPRCIQAHGADGSKPLEFICIKNPTQYNFLSLQSFALLCSSEALNLVSPSLHDLAVYCKALIFGPDVSTFEDAFLVHQQLLVDDAKNLSLYCVVPFNNIYVLRKVPAAEPSVYFHKKHENQQRKQQELIAVLRQVNKELYDALVEAESKLNPDQLGEGTELEPPAKMQCVHCGLFRPKDSNQQDSITTQPTV